jgi:hypothetical protein
MVSAGYLLVMNSVSVDRGPGVLQAYCKLFILLFRLQAHLQPLSILEIITLAGCCAGGLHSGGLGIQQRRF